MRDDNTRGEIAARVRDAISRAGLSQSEVARRLGWPQQRLARRLTSANYATDFSAPELAAVAAVLEVPVTDLMPAEPEPEPAGGAR